MPVRTPLGVIALGTSLREASVETTMARAQDRGSALGVTRVAEITHLDRVGIPVFVSVRPTAADGSLCVNAGKGVTADEAQIGALMEAIEFALAEPAASVHAPTPFDATARDVLDGKTRPEASLDLCPLIGSEIALDAPMSCVTAEEIETGEKRLLPASCVFVPGPKPRNATEAAFPYSSNGLASGNTLLEATVHGLAEVIERDIMSFASLRGVGTLVSMDTLPPAAAVLAKRILSADLRLWIHTYENPFGIPYFSARILDVAEATPLFFNGGFGCHPHSSIALVRALCEAAQSRLTLIHGGRDDITDGYGRSQSALLKEPELYSADGISAAMSRDRTVDFDQIANYSECASTLNDCYSLMVQMIGNVGARQVYRVAFTSPEDELQVVKIIVPKLEIFSNVTWRVGTRLGSYISSNR